MTIIVKTTRLILRTVRLGDAKASFAIYSDHEVMRWLDSESPFSTVGEARASIKRGMDCQRRHGVSHWAVVLKSSGKLIGHCGFHPKNAGNSDLELVVHLNRGYWNQGYATEAARAACKYVFESCDAGQVMALTMPDNIPSQKLLRKIGFTRKGPSIAESGVNEIVDNLLLYEMRATDRMEERPG